MLPHWGTLWPRLRFGQAFGCNSILTKCVGAPPRTLSPLNGAGSVAGEAVRVGADGTQALEQIYRIATGASLATVVPHAAVAVHTGGSAWPAITVLASPAYTLRDSTRFPALKPVNAG